MADLGSYLDMTGARARAQFRDLLRRQPVPARRQADFLPAETLLCLAASFLVNHRQFGGSTSHRAPEPVPALGALFSRRPSSILAKMANLDGSRSHGARWDAYAGALLREDLPRLTQIYLLLLRSARAEGIGPDRLPDFLNLEAGESLSLLGQDELDYSLLESALRDKIARQVAGTGLSELQTERILVAAARVGQHVFAQSVLRNCGSRCVFCGFSPAAFGAKRMLLAGHIKPWKDSTPNEPTGSQERLGRLPATRCRLRHRPARGQRRPPHSHLSLTGRRGSHR